MKPIHGHSGGWNTCTRTYRTWANMKSRCANPNHVNYPRYGALGIKVCDRWLSFVNFLADMGEAPAGKSLDRIDGRGNYEPSNCRWATEAEQQNNRRNAQNLGHQRFGNLLVLRRASRDRQGTRWQCLCSCGRIILKYPHHLRRLRVWKDCGCKQWRAA